jgi:hypothetical protein
MGPPSARTRAPSRDASPATGARRRLLASASLGAAAVGAGFIVSRDSESRVVGLSLAALLFLAALGLGRRSMLVQVLSRGVAWMVLAPMVVAIVAQLLDGHLPDGSSLFFAATSAAALLLARPSLHTDGARAEFSPAAYRRVFLAGAVASVTAGTVVAVVAAAFATSAPGVGVGLAALAGALLASAIGVVRMRAWGVLLGIVTSVAAVATALFSPNEMVAVGLVLTALPGLLLASPLLAARLRGPLPRGGQARSPGSQSVAVDEGADAAPPVFARVGLPDGVEEEELAHPVRVAVCQE